MHRPLRLHVAAWAWALLAFCVTGGIAGHPADGCDAPPLPPTTRGHLEPDATTMPAAPAGAFAAIGEVHYRLLGVRDCQCRAVQFAPLASTLARERHALAAVPACCEHPILHCVCPCQCDDRANKLRQCILYYAELEARNRSAGAALDQFFRIAEAEAKDDLLGLGRADLAGAHEQAKSLADQGFKLPIELASLDRQQLEAEADQVRLHGALIEFNGRLKGLIGQSELPQDERLWPAADFAISYSPIDPESAIQVALTQRAELQLLRTLNCELDVKTLPVIREFLKGLNPGLGVQATANSRLGRACFAFKVLVTRHAAEKSERSDQLEQLLAEREKAVSDEVRQALAQLVMQSQLVDLDRRHVLAWQARVQEMQDRQSKSAATFLDVLQAKLEWYKSRATFTADVMGWHRAYAQLRLAQGALVAECGMPPQ